MTNKEYFQQAVWLDRQLSSCFKEVSHLQSLGRGDERIAAQLTEVRAEISRLIALREEMRKVIDALPERKEQLVLRFRYLHAMKWEDVAVELDVDVRTARRWHDAALEHVRIPEKFL